MELDKVKMIVETNSQDDANRYLKVGWVLIETASMRTDSYEYSSPQIKYSLGWTNEGEPVEPADPMQPVTAPLVEKYVDE